MPNNTSVETGVERPTVWRALSKALAMAVVPFLAPAACGQGAANSPPARTLDAVSPALTRDLTPASARRRLGAPDVETGSGLMIHGYRLEGGRTLWLAVPGEAPIVYAQLEERDGSRRLLPLP